MGLCLPQTRTARTLRHTQRKGHQQQQLFLQADQRLQLLVQAIVQLQLLVQVEVPVFQEQEVRVAVQQLVIILVHMEKLRM